MKGLKLLLINIFFFSILAISCNKIENKKGYTVGIDKSFFPLDLMGQEKNVYGFTHDLLSAISMQRNLDLSILNQNWDTTLPSLKDNKVDAIVTSMKPYVFYLKDFDFSEMYLETGPVLLVPENSTSKELSELSGKEVGIIANSDYTLILEKFPGITIVSYNSIADLLNAVSSSTIEGALLDSLIASAYCRDLYQDKFKIVSRELNDDGLRLITLKGKHASLLEVFNDELDNMKKNGKLQELAQKWKVEISCPTSN